MNVIVVDVEMNQPSNNVIQIGAVVFNTKSGEIINSFDQLAALPDGEELDSFIVKLTGITPEMLAEAKPAEAVLASFWEWVDSQQVGGRVWAWGTDTYYLKEQATKLGVWKTRKIRNLDIKTLAQLYFDINTNKVKGGLKSALEKMGLPFIGRQHNAYCDAHNTAIVLGKICSDMDKVSKIRKIIESN